MKCPNATKLANVEWVRRALEQSSVAPGISVGVNHWSRFIMTLLNPFIKSSHLLGTTAIASEVAPRQGATRVDAESSSDGSLRAQCLGDDFDVDLRRC